MLHAHVYMYSLLQYHNFTFHSRYVGDMLAWLHQAIASEKELLHSLLRNSSSSMFLILLNICVIFNHCYFWTDRYMGKGNIHLRSFVNHFAFAADDNIQKEILSHITEGVCRPFKVSCFIDWENFSLPIEAHISAAARQRFLRSRKKFEA